MVLIADAVIVICVHVVKHMHTSHKYVHTCVHAYLHKNMYGWLAP